MNSQQKTVLWVGSAGLLALILYPRWEMNWTSAKLYRPPATKVESPEAVERQAVQRSVRAWIWRGPQPPPPRDSAIPAEAMPPDPLDPTRLLVVYAVENRGFHAHLAIGRLVTEVALLAAVTVILVVVLRRPERDLSVERRPSDIDAPK
jgi:hypothetical protein